MTSYPALKKAVSRYGVLVALMFIGLLLLGISDVFAQNATQPIPPIPAVPPPTPGMPGITAVPGPGGTTTYTASIETLLFFASLSLIPAIILMMTSFTRIIIVLSLLRQALGVQNSPSNQILVGLTLFLTFFIMSPVMERIYADAYVPLANKEIGFIEAVDRGVIPLKTFMLSQTRETDLALFSKIANVELQSREDIPLKVLAPAYVISELKTAFQIGFIVFIPFLVIDMAVASVLMSMGMMMMSPVIVSLPFKLMLFVLADGWNVLIASLVQTFNIPSMVPGGGG